MSRRIAIILASVTVLTEVVVVTRTRAPQPVVEGGAGVIGLQVTPATTSASGTGFAEHDAPRASSVSFQVERERVQQAVQFHKLWTCIDEKAVAENTAEVIAFLRSRDCPEGVTQDAVRNLKDHLMIRLDESKPQPPDYARALRDIARDPQQDMALRQYAVQHMASAYEGTADKAALSEALATLLDLQATPLSGTAMLSLVRLHKDHGLDTLTPVRRSILECMRQSEIHPATMATAVALSGDLSISEALPALRDLVANESDPLIKIAAIHALVAVGAEADHEMLRASIPGADSEVAEAIEAGLKELRVASERET